MKYVSLHHHSTYSFLDGYGQPKDHVARAVELEMSSLALTEHGNVSSHVKLEKAALEAKIKPIFGCELYTGSSGEAQSQRKNHLTVWARNENGYRNLLRMVSRAWDEGFYYEPTVTPEIFVDHHEDLIVSSGCLGSLLATSLVGGKNIDQADASFGRGYRVAGRFRELLGNRYYLEVQAFPKLDLTCAVNKALERISRKMGIPLVATADVHYPRPEDSAIQVMLHAVRPGSKASYEEQARSWGYDVKLSHPKSDKVMLKRLVDTGLSRSAAEQAIENSAEIAMRCTVRLPKAAPLQYPNPRPSGELFRRWLKAGWMYRGIDSKPNVQQYAERLAYEVRMIEDKDYVDYFLITSDMVRKAKDDGVFVGPARGSAAASLVCYLLRITEVDPLLFPDLVFERFIDVTRRDLPDIDLDFDDRRRGEVFDYLVEKYEEPQVGHLGTFTTYKAKLALDDVARVFRIPKGEVEQVKELLLQRSSGDLRASATIEDTVAMFPKAAEIFEKHPELGMAIKIEGMVKGMGRHAAGAIVSSVPLTEVVAVYANGNVSVDKKDAEYLNLLKIDNLGLSNCGLLAEAADMMGWEIEDFYELPLDDKETIKGFHDADCVGIFQFDGRATQMICKNLRPDDFNEVAIVNALARPGPLHSGATALYIDIKNGVAKPSLRHPLFDPHVLTTRYQVVYQEQILRLLQHIGKFDWTSLNETRRIISLKEGQQAFNRKWQQFWKGAKSQGLDKRTAHKIWLMCITAGAYAFNAAHSVSYGLIAWYCMWLKRHEPLIFYTAALKRLGDSKRYDLLRDALKHGIKVEPPNPRLSDVSWSSGKNSVRAGFIQIPGIGPKMAEQILDYRTQNGSRMEWEDLLNIKGFGPKKLDNIQRFVSQEDPLNIYVLDTKLREVVQQIKDGELVGENGRLPAPTHRSMEVPYGRGHDVQVVWIGTVVNRNLRDLFEHHFSKTGEQLNPQKTKDPHLREWVALQGVDAEGYLPILVDRWTYPKFKSAVWDIRLEKDLVLIRGVKKGYNANRQIHASEMWVFE